MKYTLILILVLLPLTLLGQQLKCCETKKDVETYLSGIWKIKNSDTQMRYEYWFKDGQGNLTEMKYSEKEDEYIIIDDHPYVEIIKYDSGFRLKYIDLSGNYTSELKHLDSNKMILITDGIEVEYCKTSK